MKKKRYLCRAKNNELFNMSDSEQNIKKTSVMSMVMKVVVPLIITVGLCYVLFTGIDFREMVAIIKRDCDFRWIGLAMLISIFSHIFRAMRWRIQLDAIDCHAPLKHLIYSIFGTYAVNLVFPRLGEVWRTGYIAQRENRPFTTIFGSMVADRLADTVTVALLTLVTFLLASSGIISFVQKYPDGYNKIMALVTSPWLWVGLVAVIAFTVCFFTRKTDNKFVVKIKDTLKNLWTGFSAILTMKGKGRWLVLTIMIWGCYFTQLYVAFYAFPITTSLLAEHGIIVALVCFTLSSIAMGIPSNGGIGPWQLAIIFGMTIYMPAGADAAAFNLNAAAFANLVLGSQTLLLIVLGIYTFAAIAISKKSLKK